MNYNSSEDDTDNPDSEDNKPRKDSSFGDPNPKVTTWLIIENIAEALNELISDDELTLIPPGTSNPILQNILCNLEIIKLNIYYNRYALLLYITIALTATILLTGGACSPIVIPITTYASSIFAGEITTAGAIAIGALSITCMIFLTSFFITSSSEPATAEPADRKTKPRGCCQRLTAPAHRSA